MVSSSAMKTLVLLLIIFPVLLARHLEHKVRSICSNSCDTSLILCIIIYKNNIPKFCEFFFYFHKNCVQKYKITVSSVILIVCGCGNLVHPQDFMKQNSTEIIFT